MFKKFTKNQRGFTLIELLVVIAIIGILSGVVVTSLNSTRIKARDARRVSDMQQLQLALTAYYDQNGTYPPTLASLAPNFIPAVPVDPLDSADPAAYEVYVNSNWTTADAVATNGCDAAGECNGYHIGETMEQTAAQGNGALNSDADIANGAGNGNLEGLDSAKCLAAHNGSYCYDLRN